MIAHRYDTTFCATLLRSTLSCREFEISESFIYRKKTKNTPQHKKCAVFAYQMVLCYSLNRYS